MFISVTSDMPVSLTLLLFFSVAARENAEKKVTPSGETPDCKYAACSVFFGRQDVS